MKIFVGYGFNERDQWVEDLVFPIIQAFGDDVITGKELQGEIITESVTQKIQQSNALIGFATRRDRINIEEKWTTHRWVIDEMATALTIGLPIIEVREKGVDDQGGIIGNRQRIDYEENKRDICMVDLVKTIGRWHEGSSIKLQLLPDEYAQEMYSLLRDPRLRCAYKLLVDGRESNDIPIKIFPIKGGLFVEAKNVPRQALIQVQVEHQGTTWISDYESTDSIGIRLRKD